MTKQAVNLLLLSICLAAIVLSGGVVGGLAPGGANIVISLDGSSLECPEEGRSDERVIRPCGDSELPQPNSLIPPLFSFPTSESSSESDDKQPSPGDETATPDTSSTAEPSQSGTTTSEITDQPTADTSTARSETTGTTASTGTGQSQGEKTRTESPTPTAGTSAGLDLGVPLRWLLIGTLLILALVVAGGSFYAYRRGYIDSPWNVIALVLMTFNWLLTFLVRISVRIADELRTWYVRCVDAIAGRRPSAPSTGSPEVSAIIPRMVRRLLDTLLQLAAMLGLPVAASDRWSATEADSTGQRDGSIDDIEALIEEDFDVAMAWGWLAKQTGVIQSGGHTPEEIARDARTQGYPAEAVTALLNAFRDVTYGEYDLSAKQRQAAREAYEELLEARQSAQPHTGGEY